MKKSFFFTVPETETAEPEAVKPAANDVSPPHSNLPTTPFAEMRLKIGNKIQIENSTNPGTKERVLVTVIGWLEGGSFVVAIPQKMSQRGWAQTNDKVLLRAFTGEKAFSFQAAVLKIEHFPFTYLHLSYPDRVEAVTVRHSPRHEVHFPVKISATAAADVTGYILDIGMSGARVGSAKPFSDKNPIQLGMQFELHGVPMSLELYAQIRSSKETSDERGATRYEYGVEFQNLQPNDRLALGSLLWYELQARSEHA